MSTRESFSGGLYKIKHTIFDKLAHIGIEVPQNDCFYLYYTCFDFSVFRYLDTLKLRFLDIRNVLAPGFSYSKF